MKIGSLIVLTCLAVAGTAQANVNQIEALKSEIVSLAQTYTGQGDPDFKKQKSLEVLVKRLLALNPMPPVQKRIALLDGVWKQVWGPYDYRNESRGVDPELGVNEIYQVVFREGYYYNVSPLYPKGDRKKERIGLLRGEFKIDESTKNILSVKFTDYPGVDPRPNGNIWDLAARAEADALDNKITVVPSWVVRLFFGGGRLVEVYTDNTLRITYGVSNKEGSKPAIYIMTRVQ